MLVVGAFFYFSVSLASEPEKNERLLNVIIFESYFTPSVKTGKTFDKYDWPALDFPGAFSKLIGVHNSQTLDIPSTFQFPPNPMFVDIYTFSVPETQRDRKVRFSRRNHITMLGYKLAVILRSDDRYEIALDGSHDGLKFRNVVVQAPRDRTEMIRIRLSANRTLYVALTFVLPADEAVHELIYPKPVSRPAPVYPSQLRGRKWGGNVRILCTITPEGEVEPQNYVFLECPHTLFARNSLNAVLNEWKFEPATNGGVPVSFRMKLNVPFSYFSHDMILEMPLPKPAPLPR